MAALTERDPAKNRLVAVALASSGYAIGYYISIMNSMAAPMLDGVFKLSKDDRIAALGNLNFFFALGGSIGVLVGSKVMDSIGRRNSNILLDVVSIVVILLMSVQNLTLFTALRFLIGFNASAYTMIAGITMVEIYPSSLGAVGNMINYSILTGCILLTFVQQIVFGFDTLRDHWRVFLCYPVLIPAARLAVLLLHMTYESPVFLLARLRGSSDLRPALKASLAAVYNDDGLDAHVEVLVAQAETRAAAVSFTDIFGPRYRKALVSGLIGLLGQQFTGINFLVFFSTELFDRISGTGKVISFVFGVGNFLASFLGIYIINLFSRIFILKTGVYIQGVALLLLLLCIWVGFYSILPLFMLVYIVSYSVGFGGTVVLYVNEILPPAGVAFCVASTWMLCSLIGKFSPIAVEMFGGNAMIFFFGVSCLVLGFVVSHFCIEIIGVQKNTDVQESSGHELKERILTN